MSAPSYPALTDVHVRFMQGTVEEPDGVREVYQRWFDELAPDTDGWLAATGGITSDGLFLSVLRFASAEAGRRNRDTDAQREWWDELCRHLGDDAYVEDSGTVATFGDGRPDDAGFLEVVQGRTDPLPDLLERVVSHEEHHIREHHLPLLGGMIIGHAGDRFTEIMYLPAEDSADPEGRDEIERESITLIERVAHAFDIEHRHIRDPWLHRH